MWYNDLMTTISWTIIKSGKLTRTQCDVCSHIFADTDEARTLHENGHLRDDIKKLQRQVDDLRVGRAKEQAPTVVAPARVMTPTLPAIPRAIRNTPARGLPVFPETVK